MIHLEYKYLNKDECNRLSIRTFNLNEQIGLFMRNFNQRRINIRICAIQTLVFLQQVFLWNGTCH
ncbi:hypothetical protein pb186bvf_018145 [Paramecium bursaria]